MSESEENKKAAQTDAANKLETDEEATNELETDEEREQALAKALMIAEHQERNPRCVQDIMAYPYFSLTKQKRTKPMRFANKEQNIRIEVHGLEIHGIANIHDADLLLWFSAEVRRHYEKTGRITHRIFYNPRKMLVEIGRGKGGMQIKRLQESLERLVSTYIHTTVRTEHQEKKGGFHWLDSWTSSEDNKTGEPKNFWSVSMSDWLIQGIIQDTNILTLNTDYYALTSGLEKRLYQIARKHAGKQNFGAVMTMDTLYKKTGSSEDTRKFAYKVRELAREKGSLLDYNISVVPDKGSEKVWFGHNSIPRVVHKDED